MISASEIVENLLEDFGEDPQELKDFASGAGEKGVPLEGLPNDFGYRQMAVRLEGVRGGTKKVDRNTWLIRHADGKITLRLHETDIMTWLPDNTVIVDTDGYLSKSSLERLSQFMPIGGWTIYAQTPRGPNRISGPDYEKNVMGQTHTFNIRIGNWFWSNGSMDKQRANPKYHRDQPFTDGDKIDASGTLYPQAAPVFRKRGKFLPERPSATAPSAPGL